MYIYIYIILYVLYSYHIRNSIRIHCTLYYVQCTVYNVHCTLYNIHCIMYIVNCTYTRIAKQ